MIVRRRLRGSYTAIALDRKLELVKLVLEQKLSVGEAVSKLNMHYNTGKQIVERFLKNGHIYDGRYRRGKELLLN